MHIWTPPKASRIVFDVDLLGDLPSEVIRRGQATRWRRERRGPFYEKFNLPFSGHGHTTLPINDPRWPAMLDEIAELTGRGGVGIRGFGVWWLEEPRPRAATKSAWFELSAGPAAIRDPTRAPGGRHLVSREYAGYASRTLATEAFRRAVEESGLRGLQFLPLEDWDGWFQVWTTNPLGRGLDHPLVDPNKLHTKADPDRPILADRRRGEPWAWIKYLWDDIDIGSPTVARLVQLGDDQLCRICGPRRYVQDHLPETDFAYTDWTWQEDEPLTSHGRAERNICCNHRARRVLIDAGVMKPSHFCDPIAIVPADRANAEILDRTIDHPLPPPVFTTEEASAELATRTAGPIASKQQALPTTPQVVDLLARRMATGAGPWQALREHPELLDRIRTSPLFQLMPESWKQVLPLLPIAIESDEDDEDPFEFEPVPPESPAWLNDVSKLASDPECAPHRTDIVIASTGWGDWFAIRRSDPRLPADAQIAWWDHETLAPRDEWPTVASFVAYLVEECHRRR